MGCEELLGHVGTAWGIRAHMRWRKQMGCGGYLVKKGHSLGCVRTTWSTYVQLEIWTPLEIWILSENTGHILGCMGTTCDTEAYLEQKGHSLGFRSTGWARGHRVLSCHGGQIKKINP